MPSWQPNWADVRFDHAAAVAAAEAMRGAARRLDERFSTRGELARTAGAEWRGPARDDWMSTYSAIVAADRAVAVRLRLAARAIDAAADEAAAEQTRRVRQRSIWQRERDAEELAALRAREPVVVAAGSAVPTLSAGTRSGRPQAPIAW